MPQSIEKIERLLQAVERLPDPAARASAMALVQALMDFHGEALDRLMEIVASQGEPGYSIFDKFGGDELVSNLLLLYGLHPLPLETRVLQALEKVKPHLASHGGDVELLAINDGVVRLRLHGSCKGCPSSAATLKLAIEAAIYEGVPDITSIEAEGAGFVQLSRKTATEHTDINPDFIRVTRDSKPSECCELCSIGLGPDHPHVVEPATRRLVCACQACAILFSSAAETKYRRVPRSVRYLPDFHLTDAQWEGLMIPINMAFFFQSSVAGKVIVLYPSPAGATESLLELESWEEIVACNPVLREMEPDTEALLVNRVRGTSDHFIVPIDECYRLVGLIRTKWKGLAGGAEVWEAINSFFAELRKRAKGVAEVAHA